MSRVSRRAGSKALVCAECNRRAGKSGKTIVSFRGRPAAYQRHLRNHGGKRALRKLVKAIVGESA